MATININAQVGQSVDGAIQIKVEDLLRRLDNLMLDADKVRWGEAERIDWFNDGASEIVLRRPSARAVTEALTLVSGTLQAGPVGTAQVMDVVRNISGDGTPGRAIRSTDRQALDDANPDWHAAAPGRTVHFMVDERNPTAFYVYPPAVGGAKVEVLVSKPPPKATSKASTIDLRPEFINALVAWALYRCHIKDSEYSQAGVAAQHYQAFTDAIGAPAQAAMQHAATANNN